MTRDTWVTLRLRPIERQLLAETAHRYGESVSGWVRGVALDAARRELAQPEPGAAAGTATPPPAR